MFRRYFLPLLACIAFIISTTLIASAQVGQLRGHVVLTQADGTKVPAADAVIDVYRTDVSGKYNTKTNKKGEFIFAGLPYAGDYAIAASHPSAQPNWLGKVKAGKDIDYEIVLTPGDGRRLTLDEINTAKRGTGDSAKRGTSDPEARAPSAEDKAKAAELAKQAAEITARNEKAVKSNEVVARTFQAGNDALTAKNYDEAIKQYEEGLAADPEQPALLVNEGRAYRERGVGRYNGAVTSTDEAAKSAGIESAKADFKAAAAATAKAVGMIKAQPVPTDPAELGRYTNNKLAAYSGNAESHRLFVSKGDPSQADAGLAAFKDYIAIETDPVKKAKAQLDAAQLLLDAGAVDKAFAEFQSLVTAEPDNPDANLGAGLSLFATGDKAKYQDAANFLQHYVDVAPETHKFKADAKAILAELKNTEKVVPEKTAPARRRRP